MSSLRPYVDSDLIQISRLVQGFFNLHRRLIGGKKVMTAGEAEAICREWQQAFPFLVYEVEGKLVGFVRLRQEGSVYWLEDIGIDEALQGQGHGRALLQAVEAYVQEQGETSLYVFVLPQNRAAIEFYVANGYGTLNMIELRKDFAQEPQQNQIESAGRNYTLNWLSASPCVHSRENRKQWRS